MGTTVNLGASGQPTTGYLAVPPSGSGPGVVVIQEWWGLVPHIVDVCDRLAAAGFVALAPDLYHGTTTTEPDEAGKLMMAMNLPAAVGEISLAVDYLTSSGEATGDGVGVMGFCMGGGLALMAACERPDAIRACVSFYGVIPWPHAEPDWSRMEASLLGHFAANDTMFTPEKVRELRDRLVAEGRDVEFIIHPDTEHAFFNDTRPEVYHAEVARQSWDATVAFLHGQLNGPNA